MYRLLIVEDEEVIRGGLMKQIPWGQFGFQVIGEAGNGKEATDMIPLLLPDIVLTDIVMPVMGGIDLIAWANEHYPAIKLVVLSGYHEFENARKCIEYRASSYLLKPTDTKEIEKVFRRVKDELDRSSDSVKITNRNAIQHIVSGKIEAEHADSVNLNDWREMTHFVAMQFQLHGKPWPEPVRSHVNENPWFQVENEGKMEIIFDDDHTLGVVLASKSSLSKEACRQIAEQVKARMRSLLPPGGQLPLISCGIGHPYREIAQLRTSWQDAALAVKAKFFSGPDTIVHIQDCGQGSSGGTSVVSGKIDSLVADIVEHTMACNPALLGRSLSDYFDTLSGLKVGDKEFIYMKTVEIMIMLSVKLTEKGISFKQIYDRNIHMEIRNIVDNGTLHDLGEWLRGICVQVLSFLAEQNGDHNADPVIERAKAYIQDHYDKKISLEEIGEHMFMTPTHFCKLFKQKTGFTFIGYLTQVRLAKAKELLKRSEMKVYEVAVAVGYDDFRHFSKLFKKYEGLNPKEWAAEKHKSEAGRIDR